MLQPKRVKYRKMFKGKVKGVAQRGAELSFGSFGLKTLESGWITNRQIESARIAVTRSMKREGKVWINIFPDKPITRKPAEVRMGKGKGALDHWVAVVNQEEFYLKPKVFQLKLQKNLCVWLLKNCLSQQNL